MLYMDNNKNPKQMGHKICDDKVLNSDSAL